MRDRLKHESWEDEFSGTIARLAAWPETEAGDAEKLRVSRAVLQALRREKVSSRLFALLCGGTAVLLFYVTKLLPAYWPPALPPGCILAGAAGLGLLAAPLLLILLPLNDHHQEVSR